MSDFSVLSLSIKKNTVGKWLSVPVCCGCLLLHQDQCDSDCPSDTEPGTEPTVAKGIELQVQESVRDDQRSIYSLPSQHSNASHDLSDARKVRWEMTRRRICDEVHMKDLDFLPFFPVN